MLDDSSLQCYVLPNCVNGFSQLQSAVVGHQMREVIAQLVVAYL